MAKSIQPSDFAAFVATPMILLGNLKNQPIAFLQDSVWQSKLGDLARLIYRQRDITTTPDKSNMLEQCLSAGSTHFLIKSEMLLTANVKAKTYPHEEFFVSYHVVAAVLQAASRVVSELTASISSGKLAADQDYQLVMVYACDATPSTMGFVLGVLAKNEQRVLH